MALLAMCFNLMQEEVFMKIKRFGRRLGLLRERFAPWNFKYFIQHQQFDTLNHQNLYTHILERLIKKIKLFQIFSAGLYQKTNDSFRLKFDLHQLLLLPMKPKWAADFAAAVVGRWSRAQTTGWGSVDSRQSCCAPPAWHRQSCPFAGADVVWCWPRCWLCTSRQRCSYL